METTLSCSWLAFTLFDILVLKTFLLQLLMAHPRRPLLDSPARELTAPRSQGLQSYYSAVLILFTIRFV